MKIEAGFDGLKMILSGLQGDIASGATAAMRDTMPIAKQELRGQVTSAGLGNRLANTWRGDVYPKSGQSANPAGYIYSAAPDIIESFSTGAQIVPLAGRRFLAIPTDNVPRATGTRGVSRRMTPEQVESSFNQDLFFKRGKSGRVLAFINTDRVKGARGLRRAARGAKSRAAAPVLMFVLVPTLRMPKVLDLDAVASRWADRFDDAFTSRLGAL